MISTMSLANTDRPRYSSPEDPFCPSEHTAIHAPLFILGTDPQDPKRCSVGESMREHKQLVSRPVTHNGSDGAGRGEAAGCGQTIYHGRLLHVRAGASGEAHTSAQTPVWAAPNGLPARSHLDSYDTVPPPPRSQCRRRVSRSDRKPPKPTSEWADAADSLG